MQAQTLDKPHLVCPWWLGYLLASPVRKLIQDPSKILSGHVRPGMTVLEPGPGMGFFTLELARLAGSSGRVIAVDIQPRMLDRLRRRAAKAGVSGSVETRVAAPDSLAIADLAGQVDFILAFAVVHELPSAAAFFREVFGAAKPGARLLFVEPAGHVSDAAFQAEIDAARDAGFKLADTLTLRRSHAVVLEK